jgi:ribosomal protein S27AE
MTAKWKIWICSGCGARAEWANYRKSCGRCGSHEREQIVVTGVREAA